MVGSCSRQRGRYCARASAARLMDELLGPRSVGMTGLRLLLWRMLRLMLRMGLRLEFKLEDIVAGDRS